MIKHFARGYTYYAIVATEDGDIIEIHAFKTKTERREAIRAARKISSIFNKIILTADREVLACSWSGRKLK